MLAVVILLLLAFPAQQIVIQNAISPLRLYMILTIIFAYVGLLAVAITHVRIQFIPLDALLLAFYTYMLMTSFYAPDFMLAGRMAGGLVILTCSYLTLRISASTLSIDELKAAIVIAIKIYILISGIWYIVSVTLVYLMGYSLLVEGEFLDRAVFMGGYYESGKIARFRGICDSPNNFGMYGVILLPALISFSKKRELFYVLALLAMLVLTISFTTYLSLLLIGGMMIFSRRFVASVIVILLSLLLAYIGIELSGVEITEEFIDSRIGRVSSGSGRFELWQFSLLKISEAPLLGYGLNQARVILEPFRSVMSTHNNFLEVLLEGGLVGSTMYSLLLGSVVYSIYTLRRRKEIFIWGLHAGVGVFIFSNANVTLYADSTIYFLAILASFCVLNRQDKQYNLSG